MLESLEEHHIVSGCCRSWMAWIRQDERFDAKMTVLIENVRHHVEEEESEFFPKVRAELDRKALAEVGRRWRPLRSSHRDIPIHVRPTRPLGTWPRFPAGGGPHQRHDERCRAGQRHCRAGPHRVDPGPAEAVSGADGVEGNRDTAQDVRAGRRS